SQVTSKIFDLRTAGLSIDDTNLHDLIDKDFAGTRFDDSVVGESSVNNIYYFVGDSTSGPGPTDSFTGGSGGRTIAITADDASNYSVSTVNGITALTNIGDPAHAGTLNLTNVQEVLFNPAKDPGGNPGSLDATGDRMLLLGPLPNGGEPATIDPGAALEL